MTALYEKISVNEAYRLINHGPVVLVSTMSADKKYNIAPVAWTCPLDMKPAKIIIVIDTGHKTFKNILETREFIVSIPHASQLELVKETGSLSGHECDKFEKLSIRTFPGNNIKLPVPEKVTAWMELRLSEYIEREGTGIIIGECISACVAKGSYNKRLLAEKNEGKTLHHLGGRVFMTPSDTTL